MKKNNNNKVFLSGKISSGFAYSHKKFGERFYKLDLMVKRRSGYEDWVPLMVSERLMDVTQDYEGEYNQVNGEFRSYNFHNGNRNRLILTVFAQELKFAEEGDPIEINEIVLDGYICRQPVYRKTPLGREIADFLLAVNRPYGKSDYIPCICWGRNARYASSFEVGKHILISGRIQSREYLKRYSETDREVRTAYEVSINKMEEKE